MSQRWTKLKVGLGPSYDALSSSTGQLERREGKTSTAAHECLEEYVVSATSPMGGGDPVTVVVVVLGICVVSVAKGYTEALFW